MNDFKHIPQASKGCPSMDPIDFTKLTPNTIKPIHNGAGGPMKLQHTQRKQMDNDAAIRHKEAFERGFAKRANEVLKQGGLFAKTEQGKNKFLEYAKRHPWLQKKEKPIVNAS